MVDCEFLLFALILLSVAARKDVFMSMIAYPRILVEGLGVLVPMHKHLNC